MEAEEFWINLYITDKVKFFKSYSNFCVNQ